MKPEGHETYYENYLSVKNTKLSSDTVLANHLLASMDPRFQEEELLAQPVAAPGFW